MDRQTISFTLNGAPVAIEAPTSAVLAEVLREQCALTGIKLACSRTVCGACTILIDERPVAACSTFLFQVEGAEIVTVEGLAKGDELDPVQAAFADNSAFQCGYCTAGMIMLTKGLLARHPQPDRKTIVDWISSNICRCTGYAMIIEAVEDAARRMAAGASK